MLAIFSDYTLLAIVVSAAAVLCIPPLRSPSGYFTLSVATAIVMYRSAFLGYALIVLALFAVAQIGFCYRPSSDNTLAINNGGSAAAASHVHWIVRLLTIVVDLLVLLSMIHKLIQTIWGWQFRGKFRLLDPLVPRSGLRDSQIFGYRVSLDLSRYHQRRVYIGNYERRETQQVKRLLRPGMAVVDVGANIGYYTALAARNVGPSGKVFAIEPNLGPFTVLKNLATLNHIQQVVLCPSALGDAPGILPLYFEPWTDNASLSPDERELRSLQVTQVEVRTLDSCIAEWKIPRLDFLKIDVEGHEPAVLRGASEALRRRQIGTVLCEFNGPCLRENRTSGDALRGVPTISRFQMYLA